MASSIWIEEESGTCTTYRHPHNGYYAGDFARTEQGPTRPQLSHYPLPEGALS
ncbi:MAG TPA: hypothetical protein VFG63_10440 [Nocardioidaceae bacterium]|nr:hypothetical protein [Nocardioidaceae bacterium]